MPSLPSEIRTYLLAFLSHWQSYATGGLVTGLIGLIERLRERNLSKRAYVLIFVGAFSLASFFMVWRDQFERAESLQAQVNSKPQQPTIQVNVPPAQVIIQGAPEKEIKKPSSVREPQKEANKKTSEQHIPDQKQPATPSTAKPLLATVRLASQKTVVSTNADYPYALEVVLQTDTPIEPVAFALACDGPIGSGNAGLSGGGVFLKTKTGQINDNPNMFGFEWESPAFTPDKNIIVTLFSKVYIQVTGIQRIQYQWP